MGRVSLREPQTMTMRIVANIVMVMANVLGRRRHPKDAQLPTNGGFILAMNHLSIADPPIVAAFVYERGWYPRFMAKAELFAKWPLGAVLRSIGQIPVDRRSSQAAQSLKDAADALSAGRCVIIFPEGTTTKREDLWPMPMKTGAVRLALTTGAPLIPAAIWGSAGAMPPKLGRRPVITFAIGEPMDLSGYAGKQADTAALRVATNEMHAQICGLVGELRGETPPAAGTAAGSTDVDAGGSAAAGAKRSDNDSSTDLGESAQS